jgi:hypothetical protein
MLKVSCLLHGESTLFFCKSVTLCSYTFLINLMMKWAPLNHQSVSTRLHGTTSQKTVVFIVNKCIKTQNMTVCNSEVELYFVDENCVCVLLLGNSVWNWMVWLYGFKVNVIQRLALKWQQLNNGYSYVQHIKHLKNAQQLTTRGTH